VALSALLIGLIGGVIGLAYFTYGKRQQKFAPMLAGVLLGIFPLFTDNPWILAIIGVALMAAPFFIDF